MSILGQIVGVAAAAGQIAGVAGNVAALLGAGGVPSGLGPWAAMLQPASWRSIQFVVIESRIVAGRKTAIHDYPFRDVVWVEDLGRKSRKYAFRGYLVGDDVYQQRDRLLAAIEKPGPGTLVHPSIGARQVSIVGDPVLSERAEDGRMVSVDFEFTEGAGAAALPSSGQSTQSQVALAGTNAGGAVSSDFGSSIASSLAVGASVVAQVASVAGQFAGQVTGLIADASRVAGAVKGIGFLVPSGYFGRYANGGLTAPPLIATPINTALPLGIQTATATSALLAASTAGAAAVSTAAGAVSTLAVAL
jgi:prophage DNA circulation protein